MADFVRLEQDLTRVLSLSHPPVAIAFRETPPPGVAPIDGAQPSGCAFWRLAAEGRTFYTVPSDHYNCPVGSYTHNIPLPPEREAELTDTLGLMVDVGYLETDEVPGIPRLRQTPAVIVYAPLSVTPVAPDAVLLAGTPSKLMLLHEAATRANRRVLPMLGRPTCMAIPAAISGGVASSLGCVGNRVYTSVGDDELYTVIAGANLVSIVDQLDTIVSANAALAEYHRQRRATLCTT